MADGIKRGSALAALRAGSVISGESGNGTGQAETEKTAGKKLEGAGDSATGTATAAATGTGTGPASPAQIFGARKPEDYESIGERPKFGIHPKTGEQVEIDYSISGASAQAPFGLLADGTPRQKRPRGKGVQKHAGAASVAKSNENISVLADAIRFAHMGIAGVTKHAHWQQSENEAQAYADALTDLQSAYGFDISPKQAAWAKMLTVIAIPTGARIIASATITNNAKKAPVVARQENRQGNDNKKQADKPVTPKPTKTNEMSPSQLFEQMGGRFTDDAAG